jgi:hypothetical protein
LNPAGELSKMTLADLRKKFSEGEDENQMLQVYTSATLLSTGAAIETSQAMSLRNS